MAEWGVLSLILALIFSILLCFVPTIGIYGKYPKWQKSCIFYTYWQFIFVLLAYISLTICFLTDDFTVTYVLANSSLSLPWFYKLCAVWGGHEGSMLLWVLILSFWMVLVALCSAHLELEMRARILVVLGIICFGFILFLLTTSNPFIRQFTQLQTQGRDLNPLLQDLGFLFHPPMLYMGYVGFSVAFAYAIAALWAKDVKTHWAKWARPWTLAAWCCLTLGITLGSWWAYRELGWGGWWFWDPVENASFMPWLIGTALIHSLMVSERRQQFVAWTILLAICAFSLSLIGTFLVRSGVLTSVHAFAVDPERGLYILIFLCIVIGGSLFLFAARAQTIASTVQAKLISRESALLLNNVVLTVAMLTILMGTVYPLLIDGLGLGKLSVGAPYFNAVFVPLMLPLFALMGLGVHLKWQQNKVKNMLSGLRYVFLSSVLLSVFCFLVLGQPKTVTIGLGVMMACWIFLSTILAVYNKIKLSGRQGLNAAFLGMAIAHCGVAVSVMGVAVSSGYGMQDDVKLTPGEYTSFAQFRIQFVKEHALNGVNYHGSRVEFNIMHKGRIHTVYPEKRIYDVSHTYMTEAAIDVTAFRDVYIALGEPLDDNAWSVRLYYKPLVRWIWGGGFLLCVGGLFALLDPRYYKSLKRKVKT